MVLVNSMQFVPLTPDYPLATFDCGDEDLNKFLLSRQGGIFHLTYSIK